MPKILVSFAGFHDPFAPASVGDEQVTGPILTAAAWCRFDAVYLLATPNTVTNSESTALQLRQRHPTVHVEVTHINLADPTDYTPYWLA